MPNVTDSSLGPPPPIGRPDYGILRDPVMNDRLISDGFIVLPMLSEAQVEDFRALYRKWHPADPDAFYKSYFSPDPVYKQEVEEAIMEAFAPRLGDYFLDHEAFGAMFVVKPKGDNGHIPPHQDWSFVDETKHWSLNTWCPLTDTTGDNGNIQMLPGSHLLMETVRGFGTPEYYAHLYDAIAPRLKDVPMAAGEAVFFYHGIVHCSTYNTKEDARVSLGMSLVQKGVPIIYHHLREGEAFAERFVVDTDFFMRHTSNRQFLPENLRTMGRKRIASGLSAEAFVKRLHDLSERDFL